MGKIDIKISCKYGQNSALCKIYDGKEQIGFIHYKKQEKNGVIGRTVEFYTPYPKHISEEIEKVEREVKMIEKKIEQLRNSSPMLSRLIF